MLILEGHSLRTTVSLRVRKDSAKKGLSEEVRHSGLEKRQRILSVVFLVVLPYFKSKLHAIYNKEGEARLRESLWGAEDQGFEEVDFFTGEESVVSRESSENQDLSVRVQLATKIRKFIAVCYPLIHASSEGYHSLTSSDICWTLLEFILLGFKLLGFKFVKLQDKNWLPTSSFLLEISRHHYSCLASICSFGVATITPV